MARKEKKYHFIYKTTNILSGRYYIGMHSTDDLEDGYLGSGNRLRLAIRKHGKESFKREILEFCKTREDLKKREIEVVNLDEISKEECMNLCVGGEGGWFVDIHNKTFKEKLSNDEVFRDKFIKTKSDNSKKAMIDGRLKSVNKSYDWTGKKHSDQTKQKIAELKIGTGTGETNSQYGTCWITKDGVNKKIKKEDIETYLNEGWVKGRYANIKGELVKNSKLSNDDVIKIKEMLDKKELSQSKISKIFNVHQETISKIKRCLIYKDI